MPKINYSLLVKTSRIKDAGLGLFASEIIPADRIIGEMKMKFVSRTDKYSFRNIFNVKHTIRCNFRYMNHSPRPNCKVIIHEGRWLVKSLRNIKNGTELLFDYWGSGQPFSSGIL